MSANDFTTGQARIDTQVLRAGSDQLPQPATDLAVSKGGCSPVVDQLPGSHSGLDTKQDYAPGSHFPDGQKRGDTQYGTAVGDQATHTGHMTRDAQGSLAGVGSTSQGGHASLGAQATSAALGPILADPVLGVHAMVVDDLEAVRCANENRLRTLLDTSERGYGLTLHNPEVAKLATLVEQLKDNEHQAILNLQRSVRKHPLGAWAKPIVGVGEKQLARLLAVVGDPYWNDLHDRPRTVSELWAYCGFHVLHPGGHPSNDAHGPLAAGVAPKRQRGQKANWNDEARKRCWLIATSCMKQASSPYRAIYDDARAKYADAVHTAECVRCGPSGKPAQPGSPLSPGHQNARAIRIVCKELLKDMWREAKRIHTDETTEKAAA